MALPQMFGALCKLTVIIFVIIIAITIIVVVVSASLTFWFSEFWFLGVQIADLELPVRCLHDNPSDKFVCRISDGGLLSAGERTTASKVVRP